MYWNSPFDLVCWIRAERVAMRIWRRQVAESSVASLDDHIRLGMPMHDVAINADSIHCAASSFAGYLPKRNARPLYRYGGPPRSFTVEVPEVAHQIALASRR